MTTFKVGDRVTVEGVIRRITPTGNQVDTAHSTIHLLSDEMKLIPPPAPKAEREPVPDDARVGDVYRSQTGSFEATVNRVHSDGRYETTSANFPRASIHARGEHAARGDVLVKRGPEPKRPWRVGDVVNLAHGIGVELVSHRSGNVWAARGNGTVRHESVEGAFLVRPAPTPEPAPATAMTAGERAYRIDNPLDETPWALKSAATHRRYEALAQAAIAHHVAAQPEPRVTGEDWKRLAQVALDARTSAANIDAIREKLGLPVDAQPAADAKVEREVVGYLVKDLAPGERGCPFWGVNFASPKATSKDAFVTRAARDEKLASVRSANPGNPFVPVRLTRRRKPAK